MRLGTISVREALGEFEAGVSDAQIQEALWHYYYDVGKSVTYLKNKLGGVQPPKEASAPKKEKAVSKFDQAASAAVQKAPKTAGKHTHKQNSRIESTCPVTPSPPLPPKTMPTLATDDFFWDVPWGNVPEHRKGIITVDPPCYRGGLLGGSSKLAALAAKRRKEREEAEAATATKAGSVKNTNGDADAALTMLDKLSVKDSNAPVVRGAHSKPRYPVRKRSPSPQREGPKEVVHEPEAPQPAIVVEKPAERAVPSTFASTLCGRASPPQHLPALHAFTPPFAKYEAYDSTAAFNKPSPDDVVRAAQAKGAGGGRR
jgi:elongation factor 1 alpha-like protein